MKKTKTAHLKGRPRLEFGILAVSPCYATTPSKCVRSVVSSSGILACSIAAEGKVIVQQGIGGQGEVSGWKLTLVM
jgi:hypothetical protein